MQILMPLRKGLALVGIAKEGSTQLAGHEFSRDFLRWFYLLSNTALIVMEIYNCVLIAPDGVQALLVPLHLLIAFVSVYLILISLVLKSDQVIESIDFLQEVITKSTNNGILDFRLC